MPTDNHSNAHGRGGSESRKQAVSIRMSHSDLRHIKRLAERLGARDSDVIRFAIKLMLARVSPLQDLTVRGRGLVPIFLESGPDLMRHFELDAGRLFTIINDGVEPERRVESDDIQLIAMSGIQRSYVKLRVAGFRRTQAEAQASDGAASGSGPSTSGKGLFNGHTMGEEDPLDQSLRQYLYEKYLFSKPSTPAASEGSEP